MCATISWGAHESFMHPIFVLKNGCDKGTMGNGSQWQLMLLMTHWSGLTVVLSVNISIRRTLVA
jgi:hypothetical protein